MSAQITFPRIFLCIFLHLYPFLRIPLHFALVYLEFPVHCLSICPKNIPTWCNFSSHLSTRTLPDNSEIFYDRKLNFSKLPRNRNFIIVSKLYSLQFYSKNSFCSFRTENIFFQNFIVILEGKIVFFSILISE